MERKLASIRKVNKIEPIEGADSIELAHIDGWQCVVKKGEFQIGDLGVYFEIDSILDGENPDFKFLEPKKFRIKTMKLRGCLSQGLLMPLSILNHYGKFATWAEGDDVTLTTKTTKYEVPIPVQLAGVMKGNFPSDLIPKTDEERIQNVLNVLEEIKNQEIYISQKIDGTSATFIKYNNEFRVCSRNIEFKLDENQDNLYVKIAKQYNLQQVLPEGFAIQGEIAGESIQGNKLKLQGQILFVFNVYDLNNRKYLDFDEFSEFCNKLELETVPLVYKGPLIGYSFEKLMEFADSQKYLCGAQSEGIVIRTTKETYSNTLRGRTSFKVISNKFLLKNGE